MSKFYRVNFKDGSALGTIAESLDDALNIAYSAPHQSKDTIDRIGIRNNRRWQNVDVKNNRRDDCVLDFN